MTILRWSAPGARVRRTIVLGAAGAIALGALMWPPATCVAHEVRPAYLELREDRAGEFDILFKTPMRGELRLALTPAFSGRADTVTPVVMRTTGDAAVHVWRVRTIDPLRGQTIRINGLEATMTDALVRIAFLDGTMWVRRLTPQEPAAAIPARQSGWSVAGLYLKLGVEHILLGIDHLLFVLALMIITRGTWMLVKTVTAFTIAHSITLALATLGYVHVPPAPVEAVIALSIVFVAVEIVHRQQGRIGLTARMPWLVAFTFGLLHGLGFAGALSEVGLPEGHVPLALLFFNIGVELGQLLFIATIVVTMSLIRRTRVAWPQWAGLVPPYAIGSVAMFWVIERVAGF
jgi:hydrogenase/urease accessory protein HupE